MQTIFSLSQNRLLNEKGWHKLQQFYTNKKVLVTGGCGFIGSHIAHTLVELGAQVTILDNLVTGFEENIAAIKDSVTFINKSIVDAEACDQAVAGNEIIFHLAAFISVPGSVKDPTLCHQTNVDGTYNLLNAARTHNISRFVLSSTSAIYGPRADVCSETDQTNPVSPYGATKLMGELYCKQFSLLFDVPCVSLRYFNVFGPRQNPHSAYAAVVAKFEYCMKNNEPITIFGDGQQTRDFIPVSQVVEANLVAGMAPKEKVSGQIFNIATGKSISVVELAEQMKQEFPEYKQETKYAESRDGDVKHTAANCGKYQSLIFG